MAKDVATGRYAWNLLAWHECLLSAEPPRGLSLRDW